MGKLPRRLYSSVQSRARSAASLRRHGLCRGCGLGPGCGGEGGPQVLEVGQVGGDSGPGDNGGDTDAKAAQGGEEPAILWQRVSACGCGPHTGEGPQASFNPEYAAAVPGTLQPLYRFLDLLLYRHRIGFVAWFRHRQQELAYIAGEFQVLRCRMSGEVTAQEPSREPPGFACWRAGLGRPAVARAARQAGACG